MEDYVSGESADYLRGKLARNEQIYFQEVVRVALFDEVMWGEFPEDMRALIVDALSGRLKKKPGPKARFSDWEWRCIFAAVDFLAYDFELERQTDSWMPSQADFCGPMEQAYEHVARKRKLGSGKSLANMRSSLNLG